MHKATLKRVDFAFRKRFLKGLGGPQVQSIAQYSGWTYPLAEQAGKTITDGSNGRFGIVQLRQIGMQGTG